ncbi:restriction endonuclease subunit S [Nitrosomonas supralitoralis]|uniref:Restriction endonuclease subunit S n=1 Tax=Nitrosomonas supralitoralis TaxID=2116706 RepID=A0A2P7NS16_9PROT|nr:restriction endonuclease subunit S [Nitrosomonas supralitoralis]PSJ16262.1 restriction endonuclease subunit S [Nitrosomonas supralitoralis]
MELKPGYKQTEVGVIPEDWDVCQLKDFVDINSGESPSKYKFVNEGIPYYKVEQLNAGDKYIEETPYMLKVGKTVPAGSIIFPKRGASILLNKIRILKKDSFMDTNLMTLTTTNGLVNEYLFYCLDFQGLAQIADTTSIPQINNKHINPFRIPLPLTTTEQTAIASALSDADALIQSLTRLIAKKRQIKQGAMQTLLNPYENGRLKAGWMVKKLGEITDLLTGFPFSSLGYTNEGIRLLRGSNIKRGQTDWNDEITKYWFSTTSDIRRYELLEGDIVVAMDGSLVGRSFSQLKQSDLPALLLQRVARIRSKSESFDINYIKEWVCSEIFTKHCDSLKTVTAIPHISPADIYNFVINIPEKKELQTRIATILSDMDAEIAALETKLTKYRQIKQGMMQNLLTGRIRLVKPESKTGAVA